MICFEFPLVERIRILLRLESLFDRFLYLKNLNDPTVHHYTLACIFEIMETSSRTDLKLDIIKEIDRQKQVFCLLRHNNEVDQDKLKNLLFVLDNLLTQLQSNHQRLGGHLRENEWLMILKQKMGVPGGAAAFDFPSYYYWLQSSVEMRAADLNRWFNPLEPTCLAVVELLKILRESKNSYSLVAKKGQYQQTSTKDCLHLLRVIVPKEARAIPEVSANKYVTNIRFTQASTEVTKGIQIEEDINFKLEFCKF